MEFKEDRWLSSAPVDRPPQRRTSGTFSGWVSSTRSTRTEVRLPDDTYSAQQIDLQAKNALRIGTGGSSDKTHSTRYRPIRRSFRYAVEPALPSSQNQSPAPGMRDLRHCANELRDLTLRHQIESGAIPPHEAGGHHDAYRENR